MRNSPLPNGCASGLEGTHQVTVLVRQGQSRYDGIYWGWQTCPGPTFYKSISSCGKRMGCTEWCSAIDVESIWQSGSCISPAMPYLLLDE